MFFHWLVGHRHHAARRDERPAFDALCKDASRRQFDMVMAWSVDRLGRSLQDLVSFLSELHALGIDLMLHQQGLDTTTPAGKAMFQMMGVFAEFERAMIRWRLAQGGRARKGVGAAAQRKRRRWPRAKLSASEPGLLRRHCGGGAAGRDHHQERRKIPGSITGDIPNAIEIMANNPIKTIEAHTPRSVSDQSGRSCFAMGGYETMGENKVMSVSKSIFQTMTMSLDKAPRFERRRPIDSAARPADRWAPITV
jgi:hypothetical protein